MFAGKDRVMRQVRERLFGMVLDDTLLYFEQVFGVPEKVEEGRAATALDRIAHVLADDQIPAGDRHHQQHQQQELGDTVGLTDEVTDAQRLRFHAACVLIK